MTFQPGQLRIVFYDTEWMVLRVVWLMVSK
jgi:hypothetical protein